MTTRSTRTPARVAALHARGWNDPRIARKLRLSPERVRQVRKALALPPNPPPPETYRIAYRKQWRTLGMPLGKFYRERQRAEAALRGWPCGCSIEMACWLACLEDSGPLTAAGLASERLTRPERALAAMGQLHAAGWVVRSPGRPARWSLAPAVAEARRIYHARLEDDS